MIFKTGYKPDPHTYKRAHFALYSEHLLPWKASLLESAPSVLDQNATSSCTGGSVGAAVTCALAARGTPLGFVASPRGIYMNARIVDRVADGAGVLPAVEDGGANPSSVMRGITEWGVRPMRGPTSMGDNYDCEPSNVNNEPTLSELEEEATHLIVGEYGIASTGTDRVRDMQEALAGRRPITVAIAGGSNAFQSYSGGIMGSIGTSLDHYVWLYGYETQIDGSAVFLGRNQWGTGWGEQGSFRINESGIAELGDIVVLDVKVAT